jgi:hypothetical protein
MNGWIGEHSKITGVISEDCEAQSDLESFDYKISRFSTFNEEKYAAVEQSTRLVIRYYLRY